MQLPLWLPLAFGSAFFAALVAIFGKLGAKGVDPTVATMVRSAFMFTVLLAVAAFSGKISAVNSIGKRDLLYILAAGAAGALSWICYFWALRLGKAGSVAVVDRLSVVMVLLLAAAFLGEKLTVWSGLGGLLMVAGAVLVVLG